MEYFTDLTMLCLAIALIPGGVALGHRLGALVACWSAGGAWLALRFADRLWRPAFSDMLKSDAGLDLEFWLPMSYLLLFVGFLAFVAIWIVVVKPLPKEVSLPSRVGQVLAMGAGVVAAALLFLGVVQSQVMSPNAEKRMPKALEIVRPILGAMGQTYLAPPRRAGTLSGQSAGGR